MKRGKDEDNNMGPMFPRLHVNDAEKGGPRAPPRNKMALYEQLSIPSQRFNGGVPSSLTAGAMNERSTFSSHQQSSTIHPTRKTDTRHSDFNNQQRLQQEHNTRQEEDDFRVPIFDQQSETSQNRSGKNNQNRENASITPFGAHFSGRLANLQTAKQNCNKIQKENSQDFARSDASNQLTRQNIKAPLKEMNESSHRNNVNTMDYRADSQADNTLWGDSVLNEASKASAYANNSVPLREIQEQASRSPNDPTTTNADAVSETSMVDSVCGVDISPDDVVGIIGQKHFWKARRAIVNQQRVFAVQVFELHRLIKVQRLIAGSPHLLVDENAYVAKPPKVSPIKKLPIEYVLKSSLNTPKPKTNLEKPNDDTEFSAENAVGKASLSSVQNGSQTTNCRPFGGPPSDPNTGSWNFNGPPGHQWLIPVMTPSEGLVYKPYPGPGFMGPVYGGCGPPGSMPPIIGHNFPNYGVPPSDHHHHHEGPTGVHPFAPPPPSSHGYFPAYGMQMPNPSVSSSTRFEPANLNPNPNPFNLQHQGSSDVPIEKKGPAVPIAVKFKHRKDHEVQASTASSRSDKTKDRNALPLFPTSPSGPNPNPNPVPIPAQFETVGPPRVIRVVPHNARSATASVARIFQSIQEERKQYDSG